MSSRDSASGSSTFHGGGKYINNSDPVGAGTGGGLAQLLASLVSGAPQTNGLIAPPIPTPRPQPAPGKGSIPGAGNLAASVPQVTAPGKGSLPSPNMSPAGPFPAPGYTPPNMSPAGPFPAPGYTPTPAPAPYVDPGVLTPQLGYLGILGLNNLPNGSPGADWNARHAAYSYSKPGGPR